MAPFSSEKGRGGEGREWRDGGRNEKWVPVSARLSLPAKAASTIKVGSGVDSRGKFSGLRSSCRGGVFRGGTQRVVAGLGWG